MDFTEDYGDAMGPKRPKFFRFGAGNIQNLYQKSFYQKSKHIAKFMKEAEIDVGLFAEMGRNWQLAEPSRQWNGRFPGYLHPKSVCANNFHEEVGTIDQPGGVAITSTFEATHRYHESTVDPSYMGRWASMCFKGRQKHRFRVVSVYSPCPTKGKGTTHTQQIAHLRSQQCDDKPVKKLQKDIADALRQWIDDGEEILLYIDANEDTRKGSWNTLFQSLGMHDMLRTMHERNSPMPATQNTNKSGKPIDALFTTLAPSDRIKCGFLAFETGLPGDHRTCWIDIPFQIVLGHNPPHLHRVEPPQLTLKDPRNTDRYNDRVHQAYTANKVWERAASLREMVAARDPVTKVQPFHRDLLRDVKAIREPAADKLRKKRTGRIESSPSMKPLFALKKLWTLMVKKKLRMKVSNKLIRRLANRCHISDAFSATLEEAQTHRDNAQSLFLKGLKEAPNWRKNYKTELAKALAIKKGTDWRKERANIWRTEGQRNRARRIKVMRQRGKGEKVTKIFRTTTAINEDPLTGIISIEEEREAIEEPAAIFAATSEEYERRFTRSLSAPTMQEPLRSILGFIGDTPECEAILDGTYAYRNDVDHFANLFLQAMARPEGTKMMPREMLYISGKENTEAWSKQKVNTASEPTALSFRHYMAGAMDADISEVDAALEVLPLN